MITTLKTTKAAALLHRIASNPVSQTLGMTDEIACKEFRYNLDVTRKELEELIQHLVDTGNAQLVQQRGSVYLKLTDLGKQLGQRNDPFTLSEKEGDQS